jgi:hypothetical protein
MKNWLMEYGNIYPSGSQRFQILWLAKEQLSVWLVLRTTDGSTNLIIIIIIIIAHLNVHIYNRREFMTALTLGMCN